MILCALQNLITVCNSCKVSTLERQRKIEIFRQCQPSVLVDCDFHSIRVALHHKHGSLRFEFHEKKIDGRSGKGKNR